MGTRSTIALEFADGTVQQVYCHWDGYLSHNGLILAEHYMDPFKLRDLIDQGSISSLDKVVGQKHPSGRQRVAQSYTTFYARDRGEDLTKEQFVDFQDYLDNHQYEEFEYILRQVNGKAVWFVDCGATGYVPLATALINMKELA